MTRPVFLAPTAALAGDRISLTGPEGRHAATVRRVNVGEQVDLTDGAGARVVAEVAAVRRDEVDLSVLYRHLDPPPAPRLVVVQALPKGDRAELAVELMTEAGVDEIVPWAAARCVPQWRADRRDRAEERWRATAREAAKQSRRSWIPEVTPLASTAEVTRRLAGCDLAVVLHEEGGRPLASAKLPDVGEVVIVVGPEGGLTAAELTAFGADPFRLGPEVVRTSTAGALCAAVLLSATPRWAGDPA